ncbi:MAG: DUF262 domain-containing protein [Erysipelotrichaceae bacterium]|nr:DUF262 domain-containing protein [Erysipelotrichaceae bacterium]
MSNIIELLDNNEILIPRIQRDYAYGRSSEKKKMLGLLDALFNTITSTSPEPLRLNYIYGVLSDEGKVILIDGQQRTTTLFLLRLYLSVNKSKDKPVNMDFSRKFMYSTRVSSNDFCTYLSQGGKENLVVSDQSISEKLSNDNSFYRKWRNDPTVSSMIIVLEEIDRRIKECDDKNFDKWLDNLEKITFEFIILEGFKRQEELYTAMNGRGKQLTDFEKIKPVICQVFRNEVEEIEDTINNEWIPIFWKYALGLENDYKNAVDNHDRYLYNFFKFLVIMSWCENNTIEKGDDLVTFDTAMEWIRGQNGPATEARRLVAFSMINATDQDFSEHLSLGLKKDNGTKKTNLFGSNLSLDLMKRCCEADELQKDIKLLERCMLWAFIVYNYKKQKGTTNGKDLRDYFTLMRDVYAASWDSNTPNSIEKNPQEHLVAGGIKAFRSIIDNGICERKYECQKKTFNADNELKYKILNNYSTRGCSNNITDIVCQTNRYSRAHAAQFARNLDFLIDNVGIVAFKALESSYGSGYLICEGNNPTRLYVPFTEKMLQSVFSMGSWKAEGWYANLLKNMCNKNYGKVSRKYSTKDWQFYLEKYSDYFILRDSLGAFDFETDESDSIKWFGIRGIYGLKATMRQIVSPFLLSVYKIINESIAIKKEDIVKCRESIEKKNMSISKMNGFHFECDGQDYVISEDKNIIEEICNLGISW